MLVGEGNGLFRPPTITDQNVALAVTYSRQRHADLHLFRPGPRQRCRSIRLTGARNRCRSHHWLVGPGQGCAGRLERRRNAGPDRRQHRRQRRLCLPGPARRAVRPGSLNDGIGFPTGTNPVAVIVANLNGRPDLIVANKGSNDVSILLNATTGQQLHVRARSPAQRGPGPVGLLYGDFLRRHHPDLAVSDSGSNNLMMLPSLGNGFFDDADPTSSR